jgi:rare lipoprotein A
LGGAGGSACLVRRDARLRTILSQLLSDSGSVTVGRRVIIKTIVMRNALLLALLPAALGLTACGHKKHARIAPPPPPPVSAPAPPTTPRANPPAAAAPKVAETETGIASWYGYPYHGRKAADGEIYDMEALVAAHRTLPFNTWVRVVNLRNDKVVDVRIIDRGPFIDGRIIDLSRAAAREIDLIGPGIGPVRIEVVHDPSFALATPATSAHEPNAAPAPPAPAAIARTTLTPAISAPTVPPRTNSVPSPSAPTSAPRAVPASVIPSTAIAIPNPAAFAVQVGIFFDRPSAERVRADMATRYGSARIVRREGDREMWRVLVGSAPTEDAATRISDRIRQESGERNAFVVRLD